MALAISTVITGAIYFALNSALDSWGSAKDELAIEKTLAESMERVVNGGFEVCGLRHSLELLNGSSEKIEFIPPWTDDTHVVGDKGFIYVLNRRVKPGTATPIGEVKLPESDKWEPVSVDLLDSEDALVSRTRIGVGPPPGSSVRFTYHPAADQSDVVETIWWDSKTRQIYVRDQQGVENLSENPFGVEITAFHLRYFDNTGEVVSDRGWLGDGDILITTGIEVSMEARIGKVTRTLVSFISLRNAPMHSGRLFLRRDARIPIPDGEAIQTLMLAHFSGVKSGDQLELEAIPESGRIWKLKLTFERIGTGRPKIKMVSIEYPPSKTVYTDFPHSDITVGLNLLLLDPNGLFDYDDDNEIEDVVSMKGRVTLRVSKMDVKGAGLFVRP